MCKIKVSNIRGQVRSHRHLEFIKGELVLILGVAAISTKGHRRKTIPSIGKQLPYTPRTSGETAVITIGKKWIFQPFWHFLRRTSARVTTDHGPRIMPLINFSIWAFPIQHKTDEVWKPPEQAFKSITFSTQTIQVLISELCPEDSYHFTNFNTIMKLKLNPTQLGHSACLLLLFFLWPNRDQSAPLRRNMKLGILIMNEGGFRKVNDGEGLSPWSQSQER